jgi:hypothetical protein
MIWALTIALLVQLATPQQIEDRPSQLKPLLIRIENDGYCYDNEFHRLTYHQVLAALFDAYCCGRSRVPVKFSIEMKPRNASLPEMTR